MSAPTPKPRVFRLPPLTYIVVVFLFLGTLPLGFAADSGYSNLDESRSFGFAGLNITWRALILLVPIIGAIFIVRTATIVSARGIVVRAPFGRRALPWDAVRGLSVTNGNVYAVLGDGSVRLPCVRVASLAEVARASGGRLPQVDDPTPKFPPTRRRRR